MFRAFIVSLVVLLAGCGSAPVKQSLDQDGKSSIGTVAVVSMLPPDAKFHYVGRNKFHNRYNEADTAEWNVNGNLIEQVSKKLSQEGYTLRTLNYSYSDFQSMYEQAWAAGDTAKVREQLAEQARAAGVDSVLLVYQAALPDTMAGSEESIVGYGVFRRIDNRPFVYASVGAELIDAKSGKVMVGGNTQRHARFAMRSWSESYETKHRDKVKVHAGNRNFLKAKVNDVTVKAVGDILTAMGVAEKK